MEMMGQRRHESVRTVEKADKAAAIAALARQAKNGDHDALIALCQAIAKGVSFRVSCILRNHMDVEDVSQEVLIRVCSKLHGLKDPKAFNAWLGKIVINETNRYFAKNGHRAKDVNIEDYQEILVEDRDDFLPQENAFRKKDCKMVMDIIQKLPTQQRKVILLYYYDDLQLVEIAEIMGISFQTVSQYLALARDKIKSELQAQEEHDKSRHNIGLLPIGSLLTGALRQSERLTLVNEAWLKQVISLCAEHAHVTPLAKWAKYTAQVIRKNLAGAIEIVVAATVLAVSLWAGGVYQRPTVAAIQEISHIEGMIIYLPDDEASGHINPEQVIVWAKSGDSELTAQYWQIIPQGSDTVLYTGEGDVVDETMQQMRIRGEDGQYLLQFYLVDADGAPYRISRLFTIQT